MRRVPRLPILLLVVGLLAAAVVFRDDDRSSGAASGTAAPADAGVPPAAALSASWFCSEGTSTPDGRADETVVITNIADEEVAATVTVMPGGETVPVSRTVQVGAHEEERVRVADVLETPEPGVIVEVVGGQAVVAHEIRAEDDVAIEPCARGAAEDWYFASGTTVRGAQQHLALFNPFGDDAIVDVTFLTDTGVQEPDPVQGRVVERRSRVSIPVHDLVPRQDVVAVHVRARTGRVVAERSMTFDGTAPEDGPARDGVSLSLGAIEPARTWSLPVGTTADGGAALVALANFGSLASTVEVEIVLPGDETLSPESVPVPARGVVNVDVSGRVPDDVQFVVRATARTVEGNEPPVVAELLEWWPDESTSTAVATTLGAPEPARRWVVSLPDGDADGIVSVLNPGDGPVTAEVRIHERGADPRSAPEAAIPPGRFASFALGSLAGGGRVVVVHADQPVVTGFTLMGGGGAMMLAVPDFAGDAV